MRKTFFQKVILKLLALDVRLMGRWVTNNAWRRALLSCVDDVYRPFSPQRVMLHIDRDKKDIAYLMMAKAASSALIRMIINRQPDYFSPRKGKVIPYLKVIVREDEGWTLTQRHFLFGFKIKNLAVEEVNSYFTFTFVRNPFTRWVSFFQNKYDYEDKKGKYYYNQPTLLFSLIKGQEALSFEELQDKIRARPKGGRTEMFPLLKKAASFEQLTSNLSKLPDHYLDYHTLPQHMGIEAFEEIGGKIDFLGKFETLEQDFEKIRHRFDLPPLRHANQSAGQHEDWRDYYTPKTARLIYQKYREDFERFGYEDEYPKLLNYLASKAQAQEV